jgi:anthranilate synthase component I
MSILAKHTLHRIPVAKQILADLETPLSVYLKLAQGTYSYLFESFQGGERWGRFSIIGLPCQKIIEVRAQQIHVIENNRVIETLTCAKPLDFIQQLQQQYRVDKIPGCPDYTGGLVGYFAYDTIRYIEQRLADRDPKADLLDMPDIVLMCSENVVVFDNIKGILSLVTLMDPEQPNASEKAHDYLDHLCEKLAQPLSENTAKPVATEKHDIKTTSNMSQKQFYHGVEKIKDYIVEGDIMQAILSQRFTADFPHDPLQLYRQLRYLNPSPYLFYLQLNDTAIVGSSPEILLRVEQREATVRPLAGTRPRGKTVEEDNALAAELQQDEKECAEHLMLIDLGRNDLGRVCQTNSIHVSETMNVELYSHVMHMVSNVAGKLQEGMTALDAFAATFPAGTLSGAPKIHAMEIIDELEPEKRGLYGGAIGYLSWYDNLDLAIVIRTAIIKNNKLYTQAGAGIVADSDPEKEWQETLSKSRAILRAAAMVGK